MILNVFLQTAEQRRIRTRYESDSLVVGDESYFPQNLLRTRHENITEFDVIFYLQVLNHTFTGRAIEIGQIRRELTIAGFFELHLLSLGYLGIFVDQK